MKKFFALVLAVAMIMSMAAVSMAATVETDGTIGLYGPLDYSSDSKALTEPAYFEYGDTVYYVLKLDTANVEDYELVEKLKIKAEFEMGEDLVESVDLVKKNVAGAGYVYLVGFKTAYKEGVADADVVATLEFNRKALKDEDAVGFTAGQVAEIDDAKIDVAFNLFYDNNWNAAGANNMLVDGKDITIKYDGEYALKFENDDEVEITFGAGNAANEGTFTVDVSGQGKVFVKYNTKADEAIVAANPGVEMFFVNFNNVKFNRTGEFVYEMEDGVAAYKVVDGALVEIPGLEIDDGEFSFNTRVLESYVFADAELVNPVVEAPVVAPEVTNPTTGA